MECKICNQQFSKKGIFSHVKKTHNMKPKDYYDKYLKKDGEEICPICKKPTKFLGLVSGYRTCCSSNCASKYGLLKAKEKYEVENISQIDEVKSKMRKSIKQSWDNLTLEERILRCQNISIGTKNSNCQKTKKQKIDNFEKENNCVRQSVLCQKYGSGWLQARIILEKDKLFYNGVYFVKNSDIEKIKNYRPIPKIQSTSKKEKELLSFIKSIYGGEVIENDRKTIKPLELDIYIPEKKIAIEFNGIYWHSDKCLPKNYHFDKSKQCESKGIRLIHIYEYEWPSNKIKSLLQIALGNNVKIYARNCEIRQITNQEAKDFNNLNHLQGHRNAQITYGLFYEDNLVQLMSFSKTRYNRNLKGNNDWEIIRGCPGSNNVVIGGVSKLLKHFIKENHPTRIFSYCDFNKFDGKSYEACGMKFIGYTGPDKTWIINGQPVKRNPFKHKELKSNAEAIIWGSGSKKYELEL